VATSSMDWTTERIYFSQSMEWGSSQNFTLQPLNPWKKSMNRTGPPYSGMGVNDETDRGFRVWALDTVEVKNDLIWYIVLMLRRAKSFDISNPCPSHNLRPPLSSTLWLSPSIRFPLCSVTLPVDQASSERGLAWLDTKYLYELSKASTSIIAAPTLTSPYYEFSSWLHKHQPITLRIGRFYYLYFYYHSNRTSLSKCAIVHCGSTLVMS